jgi:integrase/recombinase XerD
MKLEGKDGVLTYYLMDVENRLGDALTLVSYTRSLKLLIDLLNDLCGVTELEQVTTKHLRECIQHLLTVPLESSKGRPPESSDGVLAISTVKGHIRIWKAFFNWCYQEELMDTNPVTRLKSPKAPKRMTPAFTDEYVQKMLATCDTSTPKGFRDYIILLLLLDTGVRLAEIATLTIDNIQEGYIKVFGKGRREREIGLHPEMSKMLWKYVHKYRKSNDPGERALFIGQRGSMSRSGIEQVVKGIQKKAGLEHVKVTPHVFRHTHSKVYMENGGDLLKLSRELGHSSIQVTRIYLEDFGSIEARKDHNAFTPLSSLHLKKQAKRKRREEGK